MRFLSLAHLERITVDTPFWCRISITARASSSFVMVLPDQRVVWCLPLMLHLWVVLPQTDWVWPRQPGAELCPDTQGATPCGMKHLTSSSDFAKVWMDVNSLWNVKARASVAHHWVTHVYKVWVYLHINVHNSCHEIIRTNSTSFNFLTTSPSLMRKLLLPM